MGFLTAAYGKLQAGSYVRQLQNELTQIQSQIRRATREATDMQNQINQQYRMQKNCMTSQAMMMQQGVQGNPTAMTMRALLAGQIANYGKDKDGNPISMGTSVTNPDGSTSFNLSEAGQQYYSQLNYQNSNYLQGANFQIQGQQQMNSSQLDDWKDMMEQMMLQPLKDLEDDLQTQKDSKESQLKIATEEYEAKKKEEDEGAKMLKPDYTGQGQ